MTDFYKMDPSAWDMGTANLSLEEEAAYLRIVNAMHKHKSSIPDNDRVFAGMFRTSTRKARSLLSALYHAGKIQIQDGFVSNNRAVSDLVHRGFVTVSRAESGAKGGRVRAENAAKALKSIDVSQAIASSREEKSRVENSREEEAKASLSDSEDIRTAFLEYNNAAERQGWPKVQSFSPERRKLLSSRLRDAGGIDGWVAAIAKAEASDFICGRISRAWSGFSFDGLVSKSKFTRLMEGNYDNRNQSDGGTSDHSRVGSGTAAAFAAVAARHAGRTQ